MKQFCRLGLVALFSVMLAACGGGTSRSALGTQGPIVINQTRLPEMESLRIIEADVMSAGQPSAEQLREFAAAGVTTIIDLRRADENRGYDELDTALNLQMDYVAIPVRGLDSMDEHAVAAFADAINRSRGPVLVHCGSGSRVGAMVALRASLSGASVDEAMSAGIDAGMGRSLQGPVREHLEKR